MSDSRFADLKYIEPVVVAESINNVNELVVVDVRDEDYELGHIPGAINIPSATFDNNHNLEKLYNDNKDKTIVFHCFKSQVRGPTCAKIFTDYINKNKSEESIKPDIKVMRGGYQVYNEIYHDDPTKITKGPSP